MEKMKCKLQYLYLKVVMLFEMTDSNYFLTRHIYQMWLRVTNLFSKLKEFKK